MSFLTKRVSSLYLHYLSCTYILHPRLDQEQLLCLSIYILPHVKAVTLESRSTEREVQKGKDTKGRTEMKVQKGRYRKGRAIREGPSIG